MCRPFNTVTQFARSAGFLSNWYLVPLLCVVNGNVRGNKQPLVCMCNIGVRTSPLPCKLTTHIAPPPPPLGLCGSSSEIKLCVLQRSDEKGKFGDMKFPRTSIHFPHYSHSFVSTTSLASYLSRTQETCGRAPTVRWTE
jgi:hypothetical protein